MAFESILRTDTVPSELDQDPYNIKVVLERKFQTLSAQSTIRSGQESNRTRSVLPAKNIVEVMDLIEEAFNHYYERAHTSKDARVNFLYEEPDTPAKLEAVSLKLVRREPGMYSEGRPFQGNRTMAYKPILREVVDDPDHTGYKRAILGMKFDNQLRLTAWAQTNKAANQRALWIENVMHEYMWFFEYSGVERLLYLGRDTEVTHDIQDNRFYGRPIDYFVRTEHLWTVSQKTLEEICIRVGTRFINQ
jgi:hypothetical protein